jgi:hypothetical protein
MSSREIDGDCRVSIAYDLTAVCQYDGLPLPHPGDVVTPQRIQAALLPPEAESDEQHETYHKGSRSPPKQWLTTQQCWDSGRPALFCLSPLVGESEREGV